MGWLKIRKGAGGGLPAHWDSISKAGGGPDGPGALKLKQPDGSWVVHVDPRTYLAKPLCLNTFGWQPVLSMGPQISTKQVFVFNYDRPFYARQCPWMDTRVYDGSSPSVNRLSPPPAGPVLFPPEFYPTIWYVPDSVDRELVDGNKITVTSDRWGLFARSWRRWTRPWTDDSFAQPRYEIPMHMQHLHQTSHVTVDLDYIRRHHLPARSTLEGARLHFLGNSAFPVVPTNKPPGLDRYMWRLYETTGQIPVALETMYGTGELVRVPRAVGENMQIDVRTLANIVGPVIGTGRMDLLPDTLGGIDVTYNVPVAEFMTKDHLDFSLTIDRLGDPNPPQEADSYYSMGVSIPVLTVDLTYRMG